MSIVAEPAAKQVRYHKSFHADDSSHCHPNVGKANHDVSSAHKYLPVSPVTSHLMPPTLHPSRMN